MNLEGLPFSLGLMTLDDVPTIAEIEREVFSLPWSANTFAYELRSNPSSEYVVLRHRPMADESWKRSVVSRAVKRLLAPSKTDDSLLGYGGFWMMLEEAHICTLALRREWRGHGLGELLLAYLIERALERKAGVVTLEVRVSNSLAQNLYVKYGFEVVGRRKGYYSDNREDAYIMTTGAIQESPYQLRYQSLVSNLRARLLSQVQPTLPKPQASPHNIR